MVFVQFTFWLFIYADREVRFYDAFIFLSSNSINIHAQMSDKSFSFLKPVPLCMCLAMELLEHVVILFLAL